MAVQLMPDYLKRPGPAPAQPTSTPDPVKRAAKARKRVRNPENDVGPDELRQHHTVVLQPRDISSTGHVTEVGGRVMDQTPLDRYFSRGELAKDTDRNEALFNAGERLRADFFYSGRAAKVGSTLKPRLFSCSPCTFGADDLAVRKEAAERRFKAAMASFSHGPLGDDCRSILSHVCLFEGTTAEWAAAHARDRRGGMMFLQTVLFQLAYHYGLVKVFEKAESHPKRS